MPMAAGEIPAWKPWMVPVDSSLRTRSKAVEGATPACSASSLLGSRAFFRRRLKRAKSILSSMVERLRGRRIFVSCRCRCTAFYDAGHTPIMSPAMPRFDTSAVHAGRQDFRELCVHAPPLDLSTTYPVDDLATGTASFDALVAGEAEAGNPIY